MKNRLEETDCGELRNHLLSSGMSGFTVTVVANTRHVPVEVDTVCHRAKPGKNVVRIVVQYRHHGTTAEGVRIIHKPECRVRNASESQMGAALNGNQIGIACTIGYVSSVAPVFDQRVGRLDDAESELREWLERAPDGDPQRDAVERELSVIESLRERGGDE